MRFSAYLSALAMLSLAVNAHDDCAPPAQNVEPAMGTDNDMMVISGKTGTGPLSVDGILDDTVFPETPAPIDGDQATAAYEEAPFAQFIGVDGQPLDINNPATFPNQAAYEYFKELLASSSPEVEDQTDVLYGDEDIYGGDNGAQQPVQADANPAINAPPVDGVVGGDASSGDFGADWQNHTPCPHKQQHGSCNHKPCIVKKILTLYPPCPIPPPLP
ncbi:hypothetical protein DFQ27_002300 [Actinomortierella ambigua]|uniref:Uncharacterized protein n=1 Tax=Actinomortierella ambigua TaxID=1343610 RepID=A0A9P6Q7S3_9FUNG|nr:hypothetical protein DFQ27_002300 [Actinomortierella ambigua]